MQDSDQHPAPNRCIILKAMSDLYVTDLPQICPFFKFSNLWWFLTFSNQRQMTSLTYALTLILNVTNKAAIDLEIWKRCRFENTLKSGRDLR